MADSILRLKVESQEYDNKLKQAAQGLTRYADECRKVGGTLEVVEKETLEYVRALGQMDTTSRTATGKLAEMKKTFTELSVVYKNMTDQEKNSPFGKALATSLDQLKGRIGESKVQLDDINKSINGGGGLTGALDSLSDKFGMSVQSLAGWGTALAAGKAALDVTKDAFFASEETVDEWGRVMDSSKSLYEGFLTALNTGDISGYLSRIDSIVQAARAAYNELDRLGTMKTIQAPQMSAQQTENERMRMMIQTGRYIAPVDGRRASMQNGQLLTPDQIRRIEQQLQGGMQKVVTLVGNEVKQTGRAIDAVYNRQAQELGMSLSEFRKGTSSMAEFDRRMAGYDQYQKWRAAHTTIDQQSGREIVARGNPYAEFAKWGTFRVDGQRYNDLVKLIQQRDQQAGQAYSMQSQAYRTMNRAEGVTLRQIMGGGSGGGGGRTDKVVEDSIDEMLAKQWETASRKMATMADSLRGEDTGPSDIWKTLTTNANESADSIKTLTDALGALNESEGIPRDGTGEEKKEAQVKLYEQMDKLSGDIGKFAGGFGAISSGLKSVGIKIPKEVDQVIGVISGVSQVIGGVGAIIELFGTSTMAANTVALGVNTATMVSLESAILANTAMSAIPFFAGGGIVRAANGFVPGSHYSGDMIPALLNSGELVLNRAQQNSLANQLQGTGLQNLNLKGVLNGEQIMIVLDRHLQRSGRGELAVWK